MLTPTHLLVGQAAYLGACLAVAHPPALWEAWLAAGAALLPDLDKRQGLVGRCFPWLSEPLEYRFGHRTLTHSLLVCVALGLVLRPLLPTGAWLALVAGYASHPLIDMMTPAGVGWFWPARWRCVLPGNEALRMRAMGWGELIFAGVVALLCVPLLSLAQAKPESGSVIAAAIGNITTARERYDAEKGAHRWRLRLAGRDNLSHADVGGDYPIIGPWRGGGFLVRGPSGPRSVCRGAGCDWYADSAVAVKGEAQTTSLRRLDADLTTPAALGRALAPLAELGEVYLIGSLEARGIAAAPPTLEVAGDSVTLTYASPELLATWEARALRRVALTVQVRHAPDLEAPPLILEAEHHDAIPRELRPWLDESRAESDTISRVR